MASVIRNIVIFWTFKSSQLKSINISIEKMAAKYFSILFDTSAWKYSLYRPTLQRYHILNSIHNPDYHRLDPAVNGASNLQLNPSVKAFREKRSPRYFDVYNELAGGSSFSGWCGVNLWSQRLGRAILEVAAAVWEIECRDRRVSLHCIIASLLLDLDGYRE